MNTFFLLFKSLVLYCVARCGMLVSIECITSLKSFLFALVCVQFSRTRWLYHANLLI